MTGQPADRLQDLRDQSHRTRSSITGPHVTLRVLIPDQLVRAAADEMLTRTNAIREANSSDQLASAR